MNEHDAKKLMQIEKECINRDCDRNCAKCDIVQDINELNSAYDVVIKALEKQIAKKPIPLLNVYPDGQYECSCDCPVLRCYSYCPNCGQKLDWSNIDE